MAQNVTPASQGVDPAASATTAPEFQPSRAKAPPSASESDFGLVIERIGDTGRYVYTILDRATGRVITQIPSSDVLRLMNGDEYAAGSIFRTRV